jgi:hypothetical protein
MSAARDVRPVRLAERIVSSGDFHASNDALNDIPELRRRLGENSYLFFRGLLAGAKLVSLRRDILELCGEHGWLKADAPLLEGVYSGRPFPEYATEYMALYRKLIRIESFNAFSKSIELLNLYERILGGDVLAHPRNIARISFPRNYGFTTQPHQDFFYIRGTPETYTTWIPCGQCARELGGLTLLEGSHRLGFLPHQPAVGAGGNGIPLSQLTGRWLSADFELGDFVLFHSYTVHAALDNHTPDRLRISLDYRYQRAGEPVDPSSLMPHQG